VGTAKVKTDGTWSVSKSMTAGPQTVAVTATDAAGNLSLATVRSFVVDATPPTVKFTTSDGTTFLPTQAFTVAGQAGDATGIDRVVVQFVDATTGAVAATVVATCTGCGASATSVTWSASPEVDPGRYRVTATAFDVPGNATSATIGVTRL